MKYPHIHLDTPSRERSYSQTIKDHYRKVNIGIQTIIPPRSYIAPSIAASHRLSLLDYPKFLYMPHTLTFLVLGLSIILYFSIKSDIPDTPRSEERRVGKECLPLFRPRLSPFP